jgi:3-oxosteroid 1-dehydrogenase
MKPHDGVVINSAYDVVVVGAGGAGMTAALAAARQGLDTILIEKSAYFGGSTARSGGGVWIPGNYAIQKAGEVDPGDAEASKLYLDSIVGDVVPKIRRDTYLERGGEVMDFLKANTPVRFKWVREYADYLPEAPGGRPRGRTVEPIPLNATFLGAEHPGRLPQDQPRSAHYQGPADPDPRDPDAVVDVAAGQKDVCNGQRDRNRSAQGARRRGSTSFL